METLPHGFDPTDRLLLHHASLLGDAYDTWFIHWSQAQNVSCPPPGLASSQSSSIPGGAVWMTGNALANDICTRTCLRCGTFVAGHGLCQGAGG